ncbi:MAG: STAS domain-containing protein [Alphaproteobacteria bacterium]|nr:STAS domain-containing protein [Alphaproteobacteria bacterium]
MPQNEVSRPDTAALIGAGKQAILEQWLDHVAHDDRIRPDLIDPARLRHYCRDLLDELARALAGGATDPDGPDFRGVRDLLGDISSTFAKRGLSPTDIANIVLGLRQPLIPLLHEAHPAGAELQAELAAVNRLVDRLGLMTFAAFAKAREEVIARQQDELMELSVPVIRVWDGVLCLPIIGVLDSSRALLLTERLLETIAATNSYMTIIDITGVPTVDTATAQHLMKTVQAVQLMGAECVISGIRPAIATTMVGLGIDLSGIVTRFSLGDALRHCFQRLGLRVLKSES